MAIREVHPAQSGLLFCFNYPVAGFINQVFDQFIGLIIFQRMYKLRKTMVARPVDDKINISRIQDYFELIGWKISSPDDLNIPENIP